MECKGYAVEKQGTDFVAFNFKRREVGENDVCIDITYAGICHSDIHQAKNEWGGSKYPMVPGHEIVGTVSKVGSKVTKFKVGDIAGVGCFVDSCGECVNCKGHEEQFCVKGNAATYNSTEMDKKTPTYGGYSKQIVVKENYTIKICEKDDKRLAKDSKDALKLEGVAPLLCAGITTYSPLHRFKEHVEKGKKVGIVGLGGLGHMGVKIAAAMGAKVTVFSTSSSKKEDAKRLGATEFVNTKEAEEMKAVAGQFDLILDTVSAKHDIHGYLTALKTHGVFAVVGAPPEPHELHAFSLIMGNKTVAGSLIGGIKETQEMIDFCIERGIYSDVEVINVDKLKEAYERTIKSDVKYRFVIDTKSI